MSSPSRRRSPERKTRSPVRRRSPERKARSPSRRDARDTILNNTDMMFLLSDYLENDDAIALFNAKKSYRKMINDNPRRYKNRKRIYLEKLEREIVRLGGRVLRVLYDRVLVEFEYGLYEIGEHIETLRGNKKPAFKKDNEFKDALRNFLDADELPK